MKKLIILSVILLAVNALQGHIIRIPADRNTIQKGIDAAKTGDTVLVSPGTYRENINYNGKSITVASLFLTTRDTSYISRTIIDGNQAGSVVTFERGEKRTAVLTGFTITNGNNFNGGGIYCYLSSFTLNNIKIVNNKATHGGGINCIMSDPLLEDILVSGNYAFETGGGISLGQTKAGTTLKNVIIVGNTSSFDGGGIDLDGCSPFLNNVTITNNTAFWHGGGIYCIANCKPTLKNVTIANNTAVHSGGGIYCIESAPVFDRTLRCNIYFNNAKRY